MIISSLSEREDYIYCLSQVSNLIKEQANNVSDQISTETLRKYLEDLLTVIGSYKEINWYEER